MKNTSEASILVFDPEDVKVEGFYDVLSHEQLESADPILKFVVDWGYSDNSTCESSSPPFLSVVSPSWMWSLI